MSLRNILTFKLHLWENYTVIFLVNSHFVTRERTILDFIHRISITWWNSLDILQERSVAT